MTNTYEHRVLRKANQLMGRCNRGNGPQFKQWIRQGEGPDFVFRLEIEEVNSLAHRAQPKLRISNRLPANYYYAVREVQSFLKKKSQPTTVDNMALWIAVAAWNHLKVIETASLGQYKTEAISQANRAYQSALETIQKMLLLTDDSVKIAGLRAIQLEKERLATAREENAEVDDWESLDM